MSFLQKNSKKLDHLRWWDIAIITVIMFGYFIYSSTLSLFYSQNSIVTQVEEEFTSNDNWQALILQVILLSLAFIYLYLRNFNFSQWHIKINIKSIVIGISIFIGIALLFDLYFTLIYSIFSYTSPDDSILYEMDNTNLFLSKLSTIDLSLLIYSLLNGFYEEIFFLGICLSVDPENRACYFVYSLFIRYSFHTYQSSASAIAIGFLLGTIYYLLYTRSKEKNLFPFFLAHAITDVFGAGLISYFL